jgi:pimeloyl-ACP methyl ester carboxylesterase
MAPSPPPAYDDRGAGPALVLIHGHPFDRSMWAPQVAALSDTFRVVAPDLPGYGASPLHDDPMPMRAFADAIVELLDALGIDRAVVVGLSMGGLITMELGLHHPDRVAGVVLAATTAAPVANGEREQRYARAALAEQRGMLPLAADMIDKLFGPRAERDRELVLRLFTMMLSAPPAGAAAALRGRAARPDYSTLLHELTVPALVISGAHDHFAPLEVVEQLVGALPDPEHVAFAESGHLPNLEEPERFNEVAGAFAAARYTG